MPPSKAAIAPYFTSRLKSAWNSSRRLRVHIATPPAAIPMQRKVSQAGPWNRRLRSFSSMGGDPPPERSRHREKRSDEAIQSRRQRPTGRVLHPVDPFARDDGFVTLARLPVPSSRGAQRRSDPERPSTGFPYPLFLNPADTPLMVSWIPCKIFSLVERVRWSFNNSTCTWFSGSR